MFQAEPVLWLQSFASPILTHLFSTVTLLGYMPVYIVLLLLLVFGFRMRPGLGVLAALLLAGILTGWLKTTAALPRPGEIDARVREPGSAAAPPAVDPGAAPAGGPAAGSRGGWGFWSLPDAETLATFRALPDPSYGFPSGHVSAATAFFLAAAWFLRSRAVLAFAVVWVVMMSLSRMYLGRHFLADAIGAIVVGVAAAAAAWILFRPILKGAVRLPEEAAPREDVAKPGAAAVVPLALLGLLLVALAPFVPALEPETVGRLAGLAVSCGVLSARGFPPDGGTPARRAGRVVAGALVLVATHGLVRWLLATTGPEGTRIGTLAGGVVFMTLFLLITVAVSRRLRLYDVV